MKTQNPWMGRARGSAGNMTSSKIYDKNVMRAKAFEVSNPNTTAQQSERGFFRQVMDCCASVSDEQLRSLFGVKPKSMARRNALTQQLTAAFSVVDGEKTLDFSKLEAIGNGKKVTTPIVHYVDGGTEDDTTITKDMLGVSASQNPNLLLVVFNSDTNKIEIYNSSAKVEDEVVTDNVVGSESDLLNGYAYVTCCATGDDVYDRGFGSFIIKTRPEKKGRDIQKGRSVNSPKSAPKVTTKTAATVQPQPEPTPTAENPIPEIQDESEE